MALRYSASVRFQFTPLREGRRQRRRRMAQEVPDFNSRPSARGDSYESVLWLNPVYFNSRPSARGDESSTRLKQKN